MKLLFSLVLSPSLVADTQAPRGQGAEQTPLLGGLWSSEGRFWRGQEALPGRGGLLSGPWQMSGSWLGGEVEGGHPQ